VTTEAALICRDWRRHVPLGECLGGLAGTWPAATIAAGQLILHGAGSPAQSTEARTATKVTIALEDDLDGSPADETVRFRLGGTSG